MGDINMTEQQDSFSGMDECDDSDGNHLLVVNPAAGLPMVDNRIGSVDIGGNPYGQDIYHPL